METAIAARNVLQQSINIMAVISSFNPRLLAVSAGNGEDTMNEWVGNVKTLIDDNVHDLLEITKKCDDLSQILREEIDIILSIYTYLRQKLVITADKELSPVLISTLIKASLN